MNVSVERHEIPYPEYRAINELVHAHAHELGDSLRAVVAFGDIVTTGDTIDIDLLEVVDGWGEDRIATFTSTASLPLRGTLRLYFLRPSEFEHPGDVQPIKLRKWVQELLKRVGQGYEIIIQSPVGYARDALERGQPMSAQTDAGVGVLNMDDPLKLPKQRRK